jgi:hypothetical protein
MSRSLGERLPKGRSAVTNGRSLYLLGDPKTRASRRFRDLLAAISNDLGGAEHLSTGQMQLARRCALISVACEEMEQKAVKGEDFNVEMYGTLTDRLGRALSRLGLQRQPRDITPSLEGYLNDIGPAEIEET